MKVDLFNFLVMNLKDNTKIMKKVKRTYDRNKEDFDIIAKQEKFDISTAAGQLSAVIVGKTERELLDIFTEGFALTRKNVKEGLRFQETVKGKGLKPSDILSSFVTYKFFELLLGSWKEPDDYEKRLMALIYHNENKTKLNNVKREFDLKMLVESDKRTLISAFCGSCELYAFVHGILLRNGMPLNEIESLKLSERDCKDIADEINEVLETNKTYKAQEFEGRLAITTTNLLEDYEQTFVLITIAVIIKILIKFHQQKIQEISTPKIIERVIVKQFDITQEKLEEKQEALNKLQIAYDKQQRKLQDTEQELSDIKDYLEFMEQARDFEERKQEEDPSAKPVIPWGDGVILFGGHPTYQRKIATQYPWVRIIDIKLTKIDRNLVKNAKHILINWQYLPHRQFYQLISVIREYKKEYQYVW